jgi:serine/threonine protein kinase/formylglycine-generating enzyme required for sulfatase activity
LSSSQLQHVDEVCDRFEDAWINDQRPRIEDYLGSTPEPERRHLFRELLLVDVALRCQPDEAPKLQEYQQRFREYAELIEAVFQERLASAEPKSQEVDSSRQSVRSGPEPIDARATDDPTWFGRYRVTAIIGTGSFGVVYKGYDDDLQRDVAIKVPHRDRIVQPNDVQAYLAEARILANLDHPHIVPVHDFGRTDDGLCFVVSKFITGNDLKQMIKEARPSAIESATLLAAVAEALHYAHLQGLVHRDIKPGNILLDPSGKPSVADFGLALKEENFGRRRSFTGTPAYMSPEQARGESHRVDGRSNIFSLGVVFYELLTGRRPFRGETWEELSEQIASVEVRPPRQVDDTIPRELERICLKALSKRASERYTTAKDMANDLRHFLDRATRHKQAAARDSMDSTLTPMPCAPATSLPIKTLPSDQRPVKIVPKGLRSFDEHDADFFLELLPGPRDRDGLPDSIRFWKTRIEETDADKTFSVGLIYGPSGCGKSSLVKAGLLPRLAKSVTAVYVEATDEATEARLLKGLRRQVTGLPSDLGLVESLTTLRQGQHLGPGQKVLLVLDQFEQWLHAKRNEENTELVLALRHCDGGRVQCIVMVRDDFWMAATRFMARVEVNLAQGQNSAAVDVFDLLHARKVLDAFGRSYGRLPDNLGQCSKEQEAFLDQAVTGLAQDSKVISVRLALFAEMVKGKPWTPATLKEVGGIEGIGVTFLEETFVAPTAPPQHRLHQKAAQAVLRALRPEAGADIKGQMRSQQELLELSGYTGRPREFEELLRVLDSELRLITPTDPEVREESGPRASATGESQPAANAPGSGTRYYQLTHDYLVPSLRDWLTRKQKETRRGCAELLLADRAAVWNARPENRQLPSLLQWSQIKWLTKKKNWTPPQRRMMAKASRVHGIRGIIAAVLLALIGWGAYEGHGRVQAHSLRGRLLDANINDVKAIVDDMAHYRRWLDPLLRQAYAQAEQDNDRRRQLHTSLALLPVDADQVDYLRDRLLEAEPNEVPVIRDFLASHKEQFVDKLWAVVEAPEKGKESQRLRAAAALADYNPESDRWNKAQKSVTDDLVSVPAVHLSYWLESLRPVQTKLLDPLVTAFRDTNRRDAERTLATEILVDYASDQPLLLADLLMDADEKQFATIFPKLKDRGEAVLSVLIAEIDRKLPCDLPSSHPKREALAKRQANAAVTLLRMKQPEKVWPILKHSRDPRVRSYLIHRLSPLGADAGTIIMRLEEEPENSIRRALVLGLGEFDEVKLSRDARKDDLLPKLQAMYRDDTDLGLHAAVEWLLRQWQQEDWLKQVNEDWAKDREGRDKRVESIRQQLKASRAASAPCVPPQWYVTSEGQTMVVMPGPVDFKMGSPAAEEGRLPLETQHTRRISRTIALAAKPVTVREFRRFLKENKLEQWFEFGCDGAAFLKQYSPDENGPIIGVDWYQAAAYCNWLSQQDGIPEDQWCYETNARKVSQANAIVFVRLLLPHHPLYRAASTSYLVMYLLPPQVTAMKKNYLELRGYRLPHEAEMEYACRAGAVTSRYYGETEELLAKYGWYEQNSKDRAWPVGGKKPNDLGLFDMHGNVWNWCQESCRPYFMFDRVAPNVSGLAEDKEDDGSLSQENRVLRGGSFLSTAVLLRSANRFNNATANRPYTAGFRPARTIKP